jgi:hypothetical protein
MENIFHEIAELTDVAALVDFARRDGQMRDSGLTKYGYGRKHPAPKRDKAEEEATDSRMIAILANALRANTDRTRTPLDIMTEAINAQGLRRATWAAIPGPRQDRIRKKAIRLYREARSEEHTSNMVD